MLSSLPISPSRPNGKYLSLFERGKVSYTGSSVSDRLVSVKVNNLNSFRVPSDFNFSELLKFLNHKDAINSLSLFCAIRLFTNMTKISLKTDSAPFIPLNSEFIRKEILLVNHKHKPLIQKLIDNGYLVSDRHYIVGRKPIGYKLGPKFDGSKWEVHDFGEYLEQNVKDNLPKGARRLLWKNLWNKFLSATASYKSMPESNLKKVCQMIEEYGKKITIAEDCDIEGVLETASKTAFEEYVNEVARDKRRKLFWTQELIKESYRFSLESIRAGQFSVKCHDSRRPNFTNRVFTNITNLKKEFRDFLLYDGEKTYNSDIRASQPSLLSTFYNDSPEDQAEKAKYVDALVNHDIYEMLADGKMTRDKSKKSMFLVMFAKPNQCRGKFFDNFRSLFPILSYRIWQAKQNNYKDVARTLQLLESKIIIEGVVFELLSKGIFVTPIHDSVLSRKEDLEVVKETMERHLFKHLGFTPCVRID